MRPVSSGQLEGTSSNFVVCLSVASWWQGKQCLDCFSKQQNV